MKRKKVKTKGYLGISIILIVLILKAFSAFDDTKATLSTDTTKDNKVSGAETVVSGQVKIHYINVGQGDSILIQQGEQNMLIDAGTNASTETLVAYLKAQNIKKLDYLILTHPHEDHIGGADAVINTFSIGTVYMPKVTQTTKTFKDVVSALNSKSLKATQPEVGTNFNLGEASCTILGPINTSSGDMNSYSIVMNLVFGSKKFIFTGDAEASNEKAMIKKGLDMSADVLKLGHHGSNTATSKEFLEKVNPSYAVVSCGIENDYAHPHKEVMDSLQSKKIVVYRTDQSGNIVCTSDGKTISFNGKAGDYKNGSSN